MFLYFFPVSVGDVLCREKSLSKLMNGSSSSRQKDSAAGSSQQRHTGRQAMKRRAGAAAKAAQKYADFEVNSRVVYVNTVCSSE